MSRTAGFERTSTGIVIGCAYIPKPTRELGIEGERIQAALLAEPLPWFERVLDVFNNNAAPILLSILGSGLVYGLLKRFA